MIDPRPWDMPTRTTNAFEPRRGAWVIQRLLADPRLGFTNIIHPAAIVGNLAGESGVTAIQEVNPTSGRGGFGWEQATGARRIDFENFAAANNWKTTDDQANYEFLVSELIGSEIRPLQRLKLTTTLEAAVYTFEVLFERPASTADVGRRVQYAQQALDAISSAPTPPPVSTPTPALQLDTALLVVTAIKVLQLALQPYGYTGAIDGDWGDATQAALQVFYDKTESK